ncbi:MAG: hypothetical protein JWL65_5617 [Gammaproteobacteria bacterium]|nr:hypothetical protein [Gammaproteobacteria bacterium]
MTRFEKRKCAPMCGPSTVERLRAMGCAAVRARLWRFRRAAIKPSSGLKPPLLPREAVRLDPIASVQLADCFGQVIAHRAMRET